MSRFRCLIYLVAFVSLVDSNAAGADFQAGAAFRLITPDPLLPITGGMGPTAPATGKKGDLSVRAIVVADADTKIAMVSVDSLGFPSALGDRARAKIHQIRPDHVLIGATHTHSAPDTYAFPDGKGGHTGNLDYMQTVCDRIAEAVNEAEQNLAPAQLRVATGEFRGRIAYNFYAPDLYDRRGSVMQFVSPDGDTIGTLVNYAVHPEVLGAGRGIVSPDLVGPMCDRIEGRVGGVAMFMNGAQGGMITADNRDLDRPTDAVRGYWHDERTWEECVRIGEQLANESLRVLTESALQKNPTVKCVARTVTFPVESDDIWMVVQHSPLKYPHTDARQVSTQVNLVEIGNVQIATIPGEALPNIGFYLKRKMSGKHNLLFGLTNDAFGYILTEVDYNSFPRYDYISRVSLGEKTGSILIKETLDLIHTHGMSPASK